jgi:aryl-alcohol dehydrogenase-like predicted oxidoreductase
VLEASRELGVSLVAFSPLGRGFLTGTLREVDGLEAKDIRRAMPRFQGEAFTRNLGLLDGLTALARRAGATPAQISLAWLLSRREHVLPIPGTTSIAHLEENLGAAELSLDDGLIAELEALINPRTVAGSRYNAATQAEIDTED